MKHGIILTLTLLMLHPILISAAERAQGPRAVDWNAVEDALGKGQPQTAIERLKVIELAARREQAWPEAIKATGRRIALETSIQGYRAEQRVEGFAAALGEAPPAIQPVFQTLLAHAYWDYFRQNNWRIRQRTAAADANSADFKTWDLRRLFAEVDRHFQAALTDDALLKRTPITAFDGLLEKGTVSDSRRPTLYDFLVHEALSFYAAGEHAGTRPEDAFEIEADSPILGDTSQFLAWKPSTTDSNSVLLKSIVLLQSLLRFHERDVDRSAFLDADLARLRYGGNVASGPTKDDRQIAAWRAFIQRAGTHDLAATGYHEWAQILLRQDHRAEARDAALEGGGRFPNSDGGKGCKNLVAQIEQPSVSLTTELVWAGPKAEIEVRYRNLDHVWFRAVPATWEDFLDRRKPRPENLNRAQTRAYLGRPAVKSWEAELAPTRDYREWRQFVAAPEGLAPGYYFIFASHRADFADDDNLITMTQVWVSRLGLVLRPRNGQLEGFVLDALSGEPISGAQVDAWYLGNNGERIGLAPQKSDELGFFAFTASKGFRGTLVRVRTANDTVASAQDVYVSEHPPRPPWAQTVLFTDRAIYRPGQLIQYKGLCIRHEDQWTHYLAAAGRQVTVVFRDVNGKEIARQTHRANDYGSFAGTFTAPSDRLNGAMIIATEGDTEGMTQVVVEEYKRPKFQTTLDAPKTAPRLNDAVRVTGHALAYTGSTIDGAKVAWRVTRQVRFPPWWGWFRFGPIHSEEAREIAHGITTTAADGSFQIDFKALADASVPEKDEPTFQFSVHADVTDAAGETRTGNRSVRVGYAAIEPVLAADEWQVQDRAVEVRLGARTLDGEPLSAQGTLRVHRLTRPASAKRDGPVEKTEAGDPDNVNGWPLGQQVSEQGVSVDASGSITNRVKLGAGLYRLVFETRDRFGKSATARLTARVIDPAAEKLGPDQPQVLAAPSWEVEPGKDFEAVWGTGHESGRAFIEFEHRDRMLQRFWTGPGRTQQQIKIAVTEAMRGGFTLHITQVRNNHAHLRFSNIDVPWSNKQLDLKWETFRSRLEPGSKETWTAVIKPKLAGAELSPAELVAALYDASLDQFRAHGWSKGFTFWPSSITTAGASFANTARYFQSINDGWKSRTTDVNPTYRHFPSDLVSFSNGMRPMLMSRGMADRGVMIAESMVARTAMAPAAPMAAMAMDASAAGGAAPKVMALAASPNSDEPLPGAPNAGGSLDTTQVGARKNLQETAFFLPQMTSDANGVVRLTFTMPEALTEWKFLGFAHDRQLRSGWLEGRTVTAKEIMVQPNPPRFLREGDQLEFTVKVSNQSTNRQSGRVRLEFSFAQDERPANQALGLKQPELTFDIPAKESRAFGFRIEVPDGCGFLRFKTVAATDRLSDGEEGYLPVLSRRVFLTESLPLPIRGPAVKKFSFAALKESSKSKSLRNERVTVQMVSQPAWYAVLALPYLMEYPHECTEQIFNRYYANSLAQYITASDPRIRRVFDQWRGTPALDSPLEKNAELKSVALEETPWLRDAQDESQSRRRVAVLFEEQRLASELQQTLAKLAERQLPEGGWSWFPDGPRDEYITLYIVTGFGRLRHLGVKTDVQPALRALDAVDSWMTTRYERIKERKQLDGAHLDPTVAMYFYGRSFFLAEKPAAPPNQEAFNYWLGQARQHWLKVGRQSQAHLALAFTRLGNKLPQSDETLPALIVRSLKEHSVTNEEMGRFWRDEEFSLSWHRAPIETQALMIEAFAEITKDAPAVDDCQVWLLKQKQTQAWKTTKATADAVYALLLRGRNLLSSDALVEVEIGGRNITPAKPGLPGNTPARRADRTDRATDPEPGTGFYQVRIPGNEVTPRLGDLVVRKTDAGVSWGAVHWQYFEDIDKVKAFSATPLKLTKSAFVRENTKAGKSLRPVRGPVQVGDELVVRVELRVDRDLEYVHLKDQRGSGTEPVNVLSGYRFQDGLGYYETTRDTASHFFIGYLAKGTYVFEYPVRVQHRGAYTTGVASVECMYAPEFNSHSASVPLEVR